MQLRDQHTQTTAVMPLSEPGLASHHSWRERIFRFAVHLLIIGILFILPEALSQMGRPMDLPWQLKFGSYAKAMIFIVLFYINYFLIIPSAINSRHAVWRLVLWNIVLIAGSLFLIWLINSWLEPYWHETFPKHFRHKIKKALIAKAAEPSAIERLLMDLRWMIRDIVMLVLTTALSIALKLTDNWQRLREQTRQIEASQREQELSSLKSQLNPHFLFNTLNTIYALIAVSPNNAQKAVHELSAMLRYVLYEDSNEVPLSSEIKFVDTYVKLMELRMSSSTPINFHVEVDADMENAKVPPLLFITQVENAFKHGNTGRKTDSIDIIITASDGQIECRTSNSIGVKAPDRPEGSNVKKQSNGGIGLQNLRRRLDLLYGNRSSLEIDKSEGRFDTDLKIRLQ